ncbi:hypothetical protein QR680_011675 [Steinernema hermaphroditum]|uniref:Uncharacterized protein n=1 Tax=Steinernema hermaphroditum TaxID=289476 RepID=A0AA39I0K0_9BILA|nr:hypothetical protein QR680_011675 [Steinernema hermaphroditum]
MLYERAQVELYEHDLHSFETFTEERIQTSAAGSNLSEFTSRSIDVDSIPELRRFQNHVWAAAQQVLNLLMQRLSQ